MMATRSDVVCVWSARDMTRISNANEDLSGKNDFFLESAQQVCLASAFDS